MVQKPQFGMQTAEELVTEYNSLSEQWTPQLLMKSPADMVVLTLIGTLRDEDVLALLEKLRSREEDNSSRVQALLVALNNSPYGEGFQPHVRNAIQYMQERFLPSEKVVSLWRAELAFSPGWEKAAIIKNYDGKRR